MSYNSIPTDTRNAIETIFRPDDNNKNAIGRLWKLFVRVNHGDQELAEQDMQTFFNQYHQDNNQAQTLVDIINEKIIDTQREEGFILEQGGKKRRRKTGKKRKKTRTRSLRKRSKRSCFAEHF
jgi:hypothetical protein